jgi:hypothetical protein
LRALCLCGYLYNERAMFRRSPAVLQASLFWSNDGNKHHRIGHCLIRGNDPAPKHAFLIGAIDRGPCGALTDLDHYRLLVTSCRRASDGPSFDASIPHWKSTPRSCSYFVLRYPGPQLRRMAYPVDDRVRERLALAVCSAPGEPRERSSAYSRRQVRSGIIGMLTRLKRY